MEDTDEHATATATEEFKGGLPLPGRLVGHGGRRQGSVLPGLQPQRLQRLRHEAEELLSKANGRLCVRYYRRADGRVLTQDCPVGLARVRQQVASKLTLAAAFVMGAVLYPWKGPQAEAPAKPVQPVRMSPNDIVMGRMFEVPVVNGADERLGEVDLRPEESIKLTWPTSGDH